MPEANLASFSIEGLDPNQLETRRRAIITRLTTEFKGYMDPEVPRELLQELAVITATLRRKNAGPPAKPKPVKGEAKSKKSLDDVLGML